MAGIEDAAAGIREAAKRGEWLDLRGGELAAEVLYELLVGVKDKPRSIKLRNARITGALDLEGATLLCPLRIEDSAFDESIVLREASGPAIRLRRCDLHDLAAAQLQTRGDVDLHMSKGRKIDLLGARIGGQLNLDGVTLAGRAGVAFEADGADVAQDAFFDLVDDRPFAADGEVRMIGAHVGGQLSFNGAELANEGGEALSLDGIHVEQDVFFEPRAGRPFTVRGKVGLIGARLGNVSFNGASLHGDLVADRLTVDQNLVFATDGDRRFTVTGQVRLPSAEVGGSLVFFGAALSNPTGIALDVSEVRVKRALVCEPKSGHPLTIAGAVNMTGAHLGRLMLRGAELNASHGFALEADALRVDQSVTVSVVEGKPFTAHGGISLVSAHVEQELSLNGAILESDEGIALMGDRLRVNGSMHCQRSGKHSFTASGTVRLRGAKVIGQLGFDGATLSAHGHALELYEAEVGSLWLRCRQPPVGSLDLRHAEIGAIQDCVYQPGDVWATTFLEGCRYSVVEATPSAKVETRLQWLASDPEGYSPQPYEQLAEAYRRAGHERSLRKIGIAKQKRRRKQYPAIGTAWSLFLGATVAHGYRPSQVLLWLAALLASGSAIFGEVVHDSDLTEAKEKPAAFEPVIYTLDLLIPVISLGQRTSWNAGGAAQWIALVFTVIGWLLTAALLGGMAVRRQ